MIALYLATLTILLLFIVLMVALERVGGRCPAPRCRADAGSGCRCSAPGNRVEVSIPPGIRP
jgi:hypothetical protein